VAGDPLDLPVAPDQAAGGRRRGPLLLGLLVVVLLVAGVAAAFVVDGDDGEQAGSTGATSTTSAATSTTIDPFGTTTSTDPGAATTTLAPATTTSLPATTTTTAPPATSPTTATTVPATTTTVNHPECRDDQLIISVGTQQTQYRLGEPVRASAVIRNNSTGGCYLANTRGITIVGVTGFTIEDCFGQCPPDFFPGQVRTLTLCWDQKAPPGTGQQVAPGDYQLRVRNATSTFRILPDPLPPSQEPPPTC
jgi:hypothetical protein